MNATPRGICVMGASLPGPAKAAFFQMTQRPLRRKQACKGKHNAPSRASWIKPPKESNSNGVAGAQRNGGMKCSVHDMPQGPHVAC